MAKLFVNSGDLDQMVSDLSLHCLPITLLQVSLLQWVKGNTRGLAQTCLFKYLGYVG